MTISPQYSPCKSCLSFFKNACIERQERRVTLIKGDIITACDRFVKRLYNPQSERTGIGQMFGLHKGQPKRKK